jgi:hypothetical protein
LLPLPLPLLLLLAAAAMPALMVAMPRAAAITKESTAAVVGQRILTWETTCLSTAVACSLIF